MLSYCVWGWLLFSSSELIFWVFIVFFFYVFITVGSWCDVFCGEVVKRVNFRVGRVWILNFVLMDFGLRFGCVILRFWGWEGKGRVWFCGRLGCVFFGFRVRCFEVFFFVFGELFVWKVVFSWFLGTFLFIFYFGIVCWYFKDS